jgi:autotransporter-associated beta strand protein
VTFSGATTVTFDSPGTASTIYDVLSYGNGTVTNPGNLSVAWRGTLTNDTGSKKFYFTTGSTAARTWSAASGTWDVYSSANFSEGDNKFISGDTVTFNEPASASTVTLSGRLSPASVTVNNTSNAYTFTGADGTADITGSASLTKSGAGVLTITSAQTHTGATSVNAGTMKFTGTGSVGSTSGISLASGAVFDWGRDAAVNRDFSGSGTITRSTTAGNAVFSGNNSAFTGSWNITSGYVGLASDGTVGASGVGMTWNGGGVFFTGTGNTLSSSRTITLGAAGGILNGSSGNTNTFAAKFTGTGNLNKVSGEKAILTAVNDFTGNINISGGGTLEIGGAGQFGNGSYSGTIAITGGNSFSVNSTADQTLSGVISGGGSLNKGSSGVLALTAANTYTGTTTIGGGKLALGTGASLYNTGGFFGTAGTTNVFINTGGTLETRNWNYGAGNAFNEMRANSYAIRINGGAVRFTENTSAVRGFQVGASGATLEADSGVTYTKLAGDVSSDNIIQGVSGGSLSLTGAGNGEIQDGIGSYGTWSGTAGVTKTGAGTWILSGNNTYAGVTAVNGGTLRVDGTNSGTGAVNVGSSGTLGGSGSIAGAVNVSGVLAPGASIDSLGTGALSFATGSTFAYELNSFSLNGDLADSSGTLDIASGVILTLNEIATGTLLNGSKLTLISYSGGWVNTELFTYLGGTLADDSTFTLNGNEWLFNYNDTAGGSNFTADQSGATRFVTMTVVPEPAAALLGGIGVLFLLRRRR